MIVNYIRYKMFIIRRERFISSVWVVSMILAAALLAAMYPGLYPTHDALLSAAAGLNTPAMVAMMGPVYGIESMTPVISMAMQCLIWLALTLIVMNIFFINRHTRVDEELGRNEMLVTLPIGRLTGAITAVVCAFGLNLIISLISAFAIILINAEGTTAAGAFSFALSIGAQGFLFAAITLLSAQLFSTAGGSMGFSFGLMGLFYILRAIGDMSGSVLSFISPLGLGLKVEAFYTNAFWPVTALFLEAVVIILIALAIGAKRDVGAGVIPARKGRAHAGRFLQSPLGLTWRLTRTGLLVWAVSMFILGACYGTVIGELDKFVSSNDAIKKMLDAIGGGKATIIEAYIPMLCGILAMFICIPVTSAMNRIHAEEKRGRLEQIYSKAVTRGTMYVCFASIAVIWAAILIFLGAIGLYAVAADSGLVALDTVLGAFFIQLPAVLIMPAVAGLLIGIYPKLSAFVWLIIGYSFLMQWFGVLFDMPDIAGRISPFEYIPKWPVEEINAAAVVMLCIAAAVFFVIGYIFYRKRDIG